MDAKPLVVIRCITYNHEPFIRDALEGFVMQKTSFPFVAVVHDDASTDGTASIIREYAEKYPNIIKPIYETENQYSKRDGSLRRIMNEACDATGAKYIAFCEGDDYWIDPLKLQKQVDILENNPDINLVYTGFSTVDLNNKPNRSSFHEQIQQISYSGNLLSKLIETNFVMTVSTLYRKDVFSSKFITQSLFSLDYLYTIASSLIGRAYYIPNKMVCYRIHSASMMHTHNEYVNQTILNIKYDAINYILKTHINNITPFELFNTQISISYQIISNIIRHSQKKSEAKAILKKHPSYVLLFPIAVIRKIFNKVKYRFC